jgi:hypothetical protein
MNEERESAAMVRHWQDRFRECPVCNQVHHFVYVTEPGPSVVYCFECPVTKQVSDLSASGGAVESTMPLNDAGVPVVAAPVKSSSSDNAFTRWHLVTIVLFVVPMLIAALVLLVCHFFGATVVRRNVAQAVKEAVIGPRPMVR